MLLKYRLLRKLLFDQSSKEADKGRAWLCRFFTRLSLPLQGYLFKDYWEDIGTIKSFFDANLALTDSVSAPSRPPATRLCTSDALPAVSAYTLQRSLQFVWHTVPLLLNTFWLRVRLIRPLSSQATSKNLQSTAELSRSSVVLGSTGGTTGSCSIRNTAFHCRLSETSKDCCLLMSWDGSLASHWR
jgi:hypothetical protein